MIPTSAFLRFVGVASIASVSTSAASDASTITSTSTTKIDGQQQQQNNGERRRLNTCETECTDAFNTLGDKMFAYNGDCEYSKFVEKINQPCLQCLLGATNLETTKDAVHSLCQTAFQDPYLNYDFGDISERGIQFDNEYFNGGGEWNYEVETATGEDRLKTDAYRVKDVFYYEAQKKRISFPDNLPSFNPFNGVDREAANGIDLDGCDINAAFCCFVQDRQANDNNGNCATPYEYNCVDKDPGDNANLCYVDHTRSANTSHVADGFTIFGDPKNNREGDEGAVHCHGLAWSDDPNHPSNVFKGNNIFYISMYDHMHTRGYVRNVPGSPMCACAENMAVVTRADCQQVAASLAVTLKWNAQDTTLTAKVTVRDINFNACTGINRNNDLEDHMKRLVRDGHIEDGNKLEALQKTLVGKEAGKCNTAVVNFLQDQGIEVV